MTRFTPPTPRSRQLGRQLKALRLASGITADVAAQRLQCSASRVSRIETGVIKPSVGDVMHLLTVYGVPQDGEVGGSLISLARELRTSGWWQRMDTLSSKYMTFIAYETEASHMRNFEPTLVPGLLQTEAYARAVNSVGRETDAEAIDQRVKARLTRQAVLTRKQPVPLRMHAVLSEAALMFEVGGKDVLREQRLHLAEIGRRPNITIQVLRFAAGATLTDGGAFAVLTFDQNETPLGYIETLAGELFLESPKEIAHLTSVFDHLTALAMSPPESITYIRELAA